MIDQPIQNRIDLSWVLAISTNLACSKIRRNCPAHTSTSRVTSTDFVFTIKVADLTKYPHSAHISDTKCKKKRSNYLEASCPMS
jgi:hypothetical protein